MGARYRREAIPLDWPIAYNGCMAPSTINPFASPAGDADPATFVEADCFRGLTITGFVDRFRIFGPSERELAARIVFFYRQAVSDKIEAALSFPRGQRISRIPPLEPDLTDGAC